jgi:copper chaperone CopZ
MMMSDEQNCHVDPVVKALDRAALDKSLTAVLAIDGMGCPRCAIRVRNGLLRLEGVVLVDVLLERGVAGVAYDPERVTPQALTEAVAAAGNDSHHVYRAEFIQNIPTAQAWNLQNA